MDTLRGTFDSDANADRGWDASEEDSVESAQRRDLPPEAIGQDERRMQVRAYNHWASLLGERMFPNIEDLDPETIAVHLSSDGITWDESSGKENPEIRETVSTKSILLDNVKDEEILDYLKNESGELDEYLLIES